MSPEIQARVFDPFFSTKSPGRGLGLALVHGIVRRLGGAINLASEPGHGTTFQILLPCAGTSSAAIAGHISEIGQPAQTSQATTVLIVEDETGLRQAVSKMLGKRGFSVIEAPDGTAALDAIRGQKNPIRCSFAGHYSAWGFRPGGITRSATSEARDESYRYQRVPGGGGRRVPGKHDRALHTETLPV